MDSSFISNLAWTLGIGSVIALIAWRFAPRTIGRVRVRARYELVAILLGIGVILIGVFISPYLMILGLGIAYFVRQKEKARAATARRLAAMAGALPPIPPVAPHPPAPAAGHGPAHAAPHAGGAAHGAAGHDTTPPFTPAQILWGIVVTIVVVTIVELVFTGFGLSIIDRVREYFNDFWRSF